MADPFKTHRSVSMTLNPSGECHQRGCPWETDGRGSLDRVKAHVASTGHSVVVEYRTQAVYKASPKATTPEENA